MKVFLLIAFCLALCGYVLALDSLKIYSIDQIGIQNGDTFEDLEGMGKAIGKKQVISILDFGQGGSGSSYEALGRIIHYLHEALGFEVLIWPIGVYEGIQMQQELKRHRVDAAAAYLYRVWRESTAMRMLLQYLGEEAQREKFENLGLGCEFHLAAKEQWASEIQGWLDNNRVEGEVGRSLEIFLAIWNKENRLKLLGKEDLNLLEQLSDQLLTEVDWKPREQQLLNNMKWFVQLERIRAFSSPESVVEGVHRFRIEKQTKNWESLKKEGLQDKKIIILGFPDWMDKEWQNRVYTIGLTAYQGKLARPGQATQTLTPVGKEYWEWHLEQYGEPYLFVDLSKSSKSKLRTRLANENAADHLNALFFMSASLPNGLRGRTY